jgi:hypothetical protein
MRPKIGKLQFLHNMNVHRCKIWSLPIWGHVLNLLWRAGHFLPRIVHAYSPTAPTWNVFNGVEFFLFGKENHCNKTERKRLSGWCCMRI